MKNFIFFFIFLIVISCTKPKTVLICGDHVCINKSEAEKYFEENLTIEVRIIDNKKKGNIDLVQLNLKKDATDQRKVLVKKKNKTSQPIKSLSNSEIKKIRSELKRQSKEKKIVKKLTKKKPLKKKLTGNNEVINNESIKKIEKSLKRNTSAKTVDVCKMIKKCSIDEISKFLIKQGSRKDFPNIAIRE